MTRFSPRLYVDAARTMRPRQLLYRGRRILSPRVLASGIRERDPAAWRPLAHGLGVDPAPQSGPVAPPANGRIFAAAGVKRAYENAASFWEAGGDGLLFAFHLHGFSELARHAAGVPAPGADAFWVDVIESWLAHAGEPCLPGWHPYPTSGRIIAWTAALSRGDWPHDLEVRMRRSLTRQAATLRRSVEHDIGGNHVLRNATALVFAGICLGDGRLERRALALLRAQVRSQVLADGGHEERSTSYHRAVRADLGDVAQLLSRAGRTPPGWLRDAVARMSSWEGSMRGPDGALPLLNDAWEGPAVRAAPCPDVCDLRASGYVVLRAGDDQAVLDVGPLAPPHLPPHAHADLLSFVLWADGRQVVVDPGSFAYTGPQRQRFRGTASHNTVEVDGRDQCVLWGDFRAAFLPRVTSLDVRRHGDVTVVRASHDGYRRLDDPATHERMFVWLPGDGLVVVDRLHAGAVHRATSRLHLAPGVTGTAAGSLRITPLGGAQASGRAGLYSPYLGRAESIEVLEVVLAARPLEPFGWALLRSGAEAVLEGGVLTIARRSSPALRLSVD